MIMARQFRDLIADCPAERLAEAESLAAQPWREMQARAEEDQPVRAVETSFHSEQPDPNE
jgi:hypothetical protein